MKKVLAIAPYTYLPYFSGGQKFIAQFFEYLGNKLELTVISVPENDASLAGSYKIVPLLKSSFSRYMDRSLVSKITALVQQENFDTLICEHPYLAWLCFAVRKRTGIKVIIHTHNIEYQRFRSTGKWWWPVLKGYEKRSFKKADALFFITPEDKSFAIREWNIEKEKCIDLPFGVTVGTYPSDKTLCRQMVASKHGIAPDEKILLFNGLLNYQPNIDALKVILEKINPILLSHPEFRYKIIICGKGLPEEFTSLSAFTEKHIIYAGFVDDISLYFKAADLFLNPVQSGGGIKTKMVEAIAYGTTVIATETGATGIEIKVCGDKLVVVEDNNWPDYAKKIIVGAENLTETPEAYYQYYAWPAIIQKLLAN